MINNNELSITINVPEGTNLRQLGKLRQDLFDYIDIKFKNEDVGIFQDSASRSMDPIVVGTIFLALLPIIIDKLGDVIIEWIKAHNDCHITLKLGEDKVLNFGINTPPEKIKEFLNWANKIENDK